MTADKNVIETNIVSVYILNTYKGLYRLINFILTTYLSIKLQLYNQTNSVIVPVFFKVKVLCLSV